MLRVYSCIVHAHDLRLVVVAAIICLLATFIAFTSFRQAHADTSLRPFCVGLAALVAGLGIWATHFVAMLAYQSDVPLGYDIGTTALSVVAAVVITGLGWVVAVQKHPLAAPAAGGIIGGGVATMHYVGMAAVQVGGFMYWDQGLVAASVIFGVGLAAAAVWIDRRMQQAIPWAATLLMTAAICSLHFIAMAAAVIYPNSLVTVPVESIDSRTLAIIVTLVTLLILSVGFGLLLFDRRLYRAKLAEVQQRTALADEILRGAAERETLGIELKRQADISSAALQNMAQGISMYDEHDRLVTHNDRYAEIYGIPDDLRVEGTPFAEILQYLTSQGPFTGSLEQWESKTRASTQIAGNNEAHLRDGRVIEIQRRPLPEGGWVATHTDVTEARRASEEIAYRATHDSLTGLPNRAAFAQHLTAALMAGGPESLLAVHSIDLDRFKEVNDTLGHPIGDEILKQVSARLKQLARDGDVVTRLGGDEFALIQRVDQPESAGALALDIIEKLAQPFEFDGHTIAIGATIGISLAPDNSMEGGELLKMSDLALYRAKDESRGTHRFFEPGMGSRLRERRQVEADLRIAIQEGQFEVYYQPLVDFASQRISCFEALLRWRHPTRGMVQPADFITIAEDCGLIIPIGEWVLRQACRDAASWPTEVGVAVNLSPAQFKSGDLVALTMSALAAAELEPTRLEIEITESVLLHDETWVRLVLDQLTSLGVRIAMDDFGTGYSSLSYLRSFPFTKIKIDRSFVADLSADSDALAIIQATIQLSNKLGMKTTAEGVETAEQLRILAAEGCTQAQGFHISRPVPLSSISDLLAHHNPSVVKRLRAAS